MTDYISRADAIEAVEQEYKIDRGYMADDYTYGFNQAIQYVSDIILQDLPSADAEQVTSKLQNPCDSLLTGDSAERKEQKSKLDLISRADAIEAVCDKCPISFKEKCEWKDNGHCSMKVALEALPSADAVAVVRCNDCKWYQGVHGVQGHAPCEYFNKQVLWNDFCSNGEQYKGGADE